MAPAAFTAGIVPVPIMLVIRAGTNVIPSGNILGRHLADDQIDVRLWLALNSPTMPTLITHSLERSPSPIG